MPRETDGRDGIAIADAVEEEVVDEALIDAGEDMGGLHADVVEDGDVQERRPRGHATPYQPSTKEVELHNLTHATYRSWCPHCVASRRPNAAHRQADKERAIPLFCGDYAFVKDS